jgi:hypothetical protein
LSAQEDCLEFIPLSLVGILLKEGIKTRTTMAMVDLMERRF